MLPRSMALALTLVLLAGLWFQTPATADEPVGTFIIERFDGADVTTSGLDIVDDHGRFVLARLTEAQITTLGAAHAIRLLDNRTGRGEYFGDPELDPTMGVPPGLRTSSYAYQIVQFRGPAKAVWIDDLISASENIYGYLPFNTYLVRADAEGNESIAELEGLRTHIPYHPGFKLSPNLTSSLREWTIAGFPDTGLGNLIDDIESLGGTVEVAAEAAHDHLLHVSASTDISEALAGLSGVSWIEPPNFVSDSNTYKASAWIQSGSATSYTLNDDLDVNGSSQIIVVCDSGLVMTNHQVVSGRWTGKVKHEALGGTTNGQVEITNGTIPTDASAAAARKVAFYYNVVQHNVATGQDEKFGDSNDAGDGTLQPTFHGQGMASIASGIGKTPGTGSDRWDRVARSGPAYASQLVICDRKATDFTHETLLDRAALWDPAYQFGARISSNSWGYDLTDGRYNLLARQNDLYAADHPNFTIVRSQGNAGDGWGGAIGREAVSKNVLTVGATQNSHTTQYGTAGTPEVISDVSTYGPTQDGRVKPNVVAPGECLFQAQPGYESVLHSGDHTYYRCLTGTSEATALVSGGAALVRDYFAKGFYPNGAAGSGPSLDASSALVRAVMMSSGDELSVDLAPPPGSNNAALVRNEPTFPNRVQGWGRPILKDAIPGETNSRKLIIEDNATGLLPGESFELQFDITSTSQSLKIMLAWTDDAALPGGLENRTLVNDLDLHLVGPGSSLWTGNDWFCEDEAINPCMSGIDTTNVEEGIFFTPTQTGEYTLRVIAGPSGAVRAQPFAVVILGAVAA